MALNVVHEKLEDIPEEYQSLYSEQGGKFVLTGIAGVKTQDDIGRLQTALNKEREDHKTTKAALGVWGDLNHEEVQGKLDRFAELETAAADKIDESKLEEMAEARAKTRLAPVERENKKLAEENIALKGQVTDFQGRELRRNIHDTVRKALVASKVLQTAQEDALFLAERVFERTEDGQILTKEGVGVTPGIAPDVWLTEIQEKRPHWWPASQGGGATGGSGGTNFGGKNPWSAAHWNLTEQGNVVKVHGMEKAEQMAKAAGVHVGATKPVVKK